jgi:hypothetical protein
MHLYEEGCEPVKKNFNLKEIVEHHLSVQLETKKTDEETPNTFNQV